MASKTENQTILLELKSLKQLVRCLGCIVLLGFGWFFVEIWTEQGTARVERAETKKEVIILKADYMSFKGTMENTVGRIENAVFRD